MASSEDNFGKELGLVIELEWDPLKNQELGQVYSRRKQDQQLDEGFFAEIEAGAAAGRGSYLAISPTTIQSLSSGQTLLVLKVQFHPHIGRRFANAIVKINFSLPQGSGTPLSPLQQPRVEAYAPRKAFGSTTEESKNVMWGLEIPISASAGPAKVGVTPQASSNTSKNVEHAFTIHGTVRAKKTTCVWNLEENSSAQSGLPSEVQFALVLEHRGAVSCEVDIRGETAGGLYPRHCLKAKSDAKGRSMVLDPSKPSGKLKEYALPDKETLQQLLATWTGEVEGAVVRFQQPIIRA